MSIKAWRQFTPFYFYSAVALLMATAARSGGISRGGIVLLLVSGFFSWGLTEYILHRFIFHFESHRILGRKFVYAAHQSHHENPKATDTLFASLQISVPIAAAYYIFARAVLGSWSAASYLFIGLIAGYFCYEWLHFQAHHRKPRLRLFRYLKKYHLLHHYRTPGSRFGVTSPVLDLVFGTFQPVRQAPRQLIRHTS
jgi:sterol desaturase/sphingolipid hydroxylase (fatty acid hydroxylase superfamily)